MNDKIISHNDAPSIKVGKFLFLMGFYPATYNGIKVDFAIDNRLLGVLCNDPKTKLKKKRWFGLVVPKKQYIFLGIIWFKNAQRGANKKRWVFEVYEERNIELARKLTEDMSLFFEKKIDLRLVNEKFAY